LYEDVSANATVARLTTQEKPALRQTLPPPSSPAPPPPGSPRLPPRTSGGNVGILDTQESYDDVSGGELIEEDLYEELNN
jgi:hypothetical protein